MVENLHSNTRVGYNGVVGYDDNNVLTVVTDRLGNNVPDKYGHVSKKATKDDVIVNFEIDHAEKIKSVWLENSAGTSIAQFSIEADKVTVQGKANAEGRMPVVATYPVANGQDPLAVLQENLGVDFHQVQAQFKNAGIGAQEPTTAEEATSRAMLGGVAVQLFDNANKLTEQAAKKSGDARGRG